MEASTVEVIVGRPFQIITAVQFRVVAQDSVELTIHIENKKVSGITLFDKSGVSASWTTQEAGEILMNLYNLASEDPSPIFDQAKRTHGLEFNPEKQLYAASINRFRTALRVEYK